VEVATRAAGRLKPAGVHEHTFAAVLGAAHDDRIAATNPSPFAHPPVAVGIAHQASVHPPRG
jgi:hypothetical protein